MERGLADFHSTPPPPCTQGRLYQDCRGVGRKQEEVSNICTATHEMTLKEGGRSPGAPGRPPSQHDSLLSRSFGSQLQLYA